MRGIIDFQGIKKQLDIREVAKDNGIRLNRKGYTCCPFHSEKTPSMHIEKEYFYCFGCHVNGDVFDFVGRLNGISLLQAVELLNREYNLGLKDRASRRDRREIETEAKLRKVEIQIREQREKELKQIADNYTDEIRMLNRITPLGERDIQLVHDRIKYLDELLDGYVRGDWDTFQYFNEKDRYRNGDFLRCKGITYGT